jgi:peptidoglycan-N-acetylglucosamine deacetylase
MKKPAIVALLLIATLYGVWQLSRSRTFQLFGEIVPRVETERRVVAITFDDGPVMETAGEILDALDAQGAKATFFVCGAQFQGAEGVAEQLVAAGHELGNHSWSHVRMVFKSPSFIRSEFERTDALIRTAGHSGAIHVRAPYGKKLVGLPWYFARNDRIHVTFDVEPESDPDIDADAARIAAHVLDTVRPGSIVLLHPWYRSRNRTREALPRILEGLRARGYTFVTVSELLAMRANRAAAG